MNRSGPRHGRRSGFNSRQLRRSEPLSARPDRIALWAVILAIVAMLGALSSSAQGASSGGIAAGGPSGGSGERRGCADADLGDRDLARGDCGTDVQTLNWILRSRPWGERAALGADFDRSTERSVRGLQSTAGLSGTGVVDEPTRDALVASMRRDTATWFGPGFYGNRMACGKTLTRRTVGVAHKTLPCGSKVTIKYRGRFLRTKVVDRGPFVDGVRWDLTSGAAKRLGFEATGKVRSAIVR